MKKPLPEIESLRDAFAFREHVESSAKEGNREVAPQFYQYPVFYYANHLNLSSSGAIEVYPEHLEKLDFELEVAIIIGKEGKDIPWQKAEEYIEGFTIMNDFSARHIQWDEMKLKLGPHKGKDFATALGPDLTPLIDIESFRVNTDKGSQWNLSMKAFVNDQLIGQGNLGDMHFSFAQIIERASFGTTLYPGECIGSGTVGSGCFREYNYAQRLKNPDHKDQWLKPNDVITLQVEVLGELKNQIILK